MLVHILVFPSFMADLLPSNHGFGRKGIKNLY